MAPNDKAVAPMATAAYNRKRMRKTHGVREASSPCQFDLSGTNNDNGVGNAATIRANFENA